VHLSGWNSRTQLALGNSMVAQEINRELGVIKKRIYSIQQSFQRAETEYDAIDLRDVYLGKNKTQKLLLEIFQ
ncbi:site-specific integrase, partial [Flavobacteriaceae bacterium F89]|nr:site-specific integrase [Cerina litoralis]